MVNTSCLEPQFDLGQSVTVTNTFTDGDGVVVDPASVFVNYKSPGGTLTTLEFGVDAAVIKDSTGVYHVDIDGDEVGRWYVYWFSTGTGQASDEESFFINTVNAVA